MAFTSLVFICQILHFRRTWVEFFLSPARRVSNQSLFRNAALIHQYLSVKISSCWRKLSARATVCQFLFGTRFLPEQCAKCHTRCARRNGDNLYLHKTRRCFLECFARCGDIGIAAFVAVVFPLAGQTVYICVCRRLIFIAIKREVIRSGKWRRFNTVAEGKVTRYNELRHVHPRTYTVGTANTRSLSKLSAGGFAWILGVGEFLARA